MLDDTITSREMRLLLGIGYQGLIDGQASHAAQLFDSLVQLLPARSAPRIGQGLALLGMGRGADAITALEQVHHEWPQDVNAGAMLGFALFRCGMPARANAVLAPLLDVGDSTARDLVQMMLHDSVPPLP